MQIKLFKIKKSFKKRGVNLKPDLYWRLIILVVSILVLGSSAFGYYLFVKVNDDSNLTNGETNIREMIKKERLDKALDYFSEREKKSNEILNSPSLVVDPSY